MSAGASETGAEPVRFPVMIDVAISSPGYDLDDTLGRRVTETFGGLDEYLPRLQAVRVTFAWEGGHGEQTKLHAQTHAPGHQFEASSTDWTPEKAVERTRRELTAQIRREHDKRVTRRHR